MKFSEYENDPIRQHAICFKVCKEFVECVENHEDPRACNPIVGHCNCLLKTSYSR